MILNTMYCTGKGPCGLIFVRIATQTNRNHKILLHIFISAFRMS